MSAYTPVTPFNFGGLPEENSDYKTSKAVVLPVPLERTTSYETGTRRGPDAIIAASRNMETYDEELGTEIYKKIGIATLPAIDTNEGELQHVMDEIEAAELSLLNDEKFPIALGGEHSLTGPLVRAAAQKFKKLTVLQIDAHADLRESFHGTPLSHASVMRRVVEVCPAVQVGIRSLSVEEADAVPKLNTKIYWGKDIAHQPPDKWVSKVVADLSQNVYLTIDLDGFDPAYIPATGTPEPGGLNWHQVTTLIREVAAKKRIVAMDVVELLPQPGDHASDFLAAKLIYKTLGYVFCRKC